MIKKYYVRYEDDDFHTQVSTVHAEDIEAAYKKLNRRGIAKNCIIDIHCEENDNPVTHELKTWPEYFEEIFSGLKSFEVRENDRQFRVGDILHLREWYNGYYTGRECKREIIYLLTGTQFIGIKEGYCVMSITGLN